MDKLNNKVSDTVQNIVRNWPIILPYDIIKILHLPRTHMLNPDFIPVYMDFCFKQIFSDKEILINFLSATLLNWPFAPIVDIEFLGVS
jgi:hypothetical protein